jgi:hypothetical protein
MKNKVPAIVVVLALLALALVISTSCSSKGNDTNKDRSTTEIGTVEFPTQYAPGEPELDLTDSTQSAPEAIVDTETEEETETEAEPKESLRFTSYGNGTCAVSGIGSCTDTCIIIPTKSPDGDIVTTIEAKAFYGNSDIKVVEIPSTVTSIEDSAFGECSSLAYISVDKASKAFTDIGGVLYSADLTRIISYPAASGAASISIPKSVKRIEPMAFYGCDMLKTVVYEGDLHEWGKIDIGEMNYGLFTAALSYSTSGK